MCVIQKWEPPLLKGQENCLPLVAIFTSNLNFITIWPNRWVGIKWILKRLPILLYQLFTFFTQYTYCHQGLDFGSSSSSNALPLNHLVSNWPNCWVGIHWILKSIPVLLYQPKGVSCLTTIFEQNVKYSDPSRAKQLFAHKSLARTHH